MLLSSSKRGYIREFGKQIVHRLTTTVLVVKCQITKFVSHGDFNFWWFIQDHAYVSPLPIDPSNLRNRIETIVASIIADTMIKV